MRFVIVDTEVFAYDNIVVFKDHETGQRAIYHNDNDGVLEYLSQPNVVYVMANGKHYDQYILKAIACDFSPEEVKLLNDYIINGYGEGWEYPPLKQEFFKIDICDLFDDMQKGLSLKAIEGHLGLNIKESEVDFNLDRPLTSEELRETIEYCCADVDATQEFFNLRKGYIQTKINLGERAGISPEKALYSTNAKLTALMLKATRKEWNDGRDYVFPDNLDTSVIPDEILSFFDTIHDMSIADSVLFKTSLVITLGGMECKYAWGGVHGSVTGYYESSTETRVIQNRDVSSLYPSLIELYNYLSRNVPDPKLFYDIRRDRIAAKHNGDKQLAKDLKLPLNTVSGAQENKYNDLYDPLPTRSMRISGQLFLTVLTMRLLNACKTIKLLNLNTDGLAYSVDKSELPIVDKICAEWEQETKFELETDEISKIWIKDVNNLLFVKTSGEVKKVGGYLNYGISVKGAWSINNNMTIVADAIAEYFLNNTPVEETINNCTEPLKFQLIAKVGRMYSNVYHTVNGENIEVQRVNRVYATSNRAYGTLISVHSETGGTKKISNLPKHCIVDNEGVIDISEIDKSFYIKMANNRIKDFLGKSRKVRRTNTRTLNRIKKEILSILEEM
ncbi:MAG: DNA polymerase elongation subunit (family B) [Clostridium sp.]|nr:DNA polymerase elongation subunit (family B) [Clostridium sp.]